MLTKEAAKRREERREKRQKASGLPAAAENCRITHADAQDTLSEDLKQTMAVSGRLSVSE